MGRLADAGFTTGTPWLPVNPNHTEINAAAAARGPGLGLPPLPAADRAASRRADRHRRRLHLVLPHDPRVYAFIRRLDDLELLVLGNFSGDVVEPDLSGAGSWSELVLGDPPAAGLTLQPWEGRVHRRRSTPAVS